MELKPCPFCGAEVSEYGLPESAAEAWNRRSENERAVPVVRCRDCKHWGGDTVGLADHIYLAECQRHKIEFNGTMADELTGENDFCSWGEREDDNG